MPVVFDLQLYKRIGNGSVDGNLHGNVTVFAQAPVLFQRNLQWIPQTRETKHTNSNKTACFKGNTPSITVYFCWVEVWYISRTVWLWL